MDNPRYTQLAYNSDLVIYKGEHQVFGISDGDENWEITKYTYNGSNVTKIQVLTGNWTNRATLVW